jgi:hypothetical protein
MLRGGETHAHGVARSVIGIFFVSFAQKYLPYLSVEPWNTPFGGSFFIPDEAISKIHWTGRGASRKIVLTNLQVLFEADVKHLNLPGAIFFGDFIKIFSRRPDRTFAALGILYRRNEEGEGSVQDVVSFGACRLHPKTDGFLRRNIPVSV